MIRISFPIIAVIDVLVIGILALFFMIGYKRGFIRYIVDILCTLVVALVAIIAGYKLSDMFPIFPEKYVPQLFTDFGFKNLLMRFIDFVIFFAIVLIVLLLITRPLHSWVNNMKKKEGTAGTVNKICGGALGLILADIVLAVASFAFLIVLKEPFVTNGRAAVKESFLNYSLKTTEPVIKVINKIADSDILNKMIIEIDRD